LRRHACRTFSYESSWLILKKLNLWLRASSFMLEALLAFVILPRHRIHR